MHQKKTKIRRVSRLPSVLAGIGLALAAVMLWGCSIPSDNRLAPQLFSEELQIDRVSTAEKPAEPVMPSMPDSPPCRELPRRLALNDTILMSLENNRSLQMRRFDPLIRETDERQELSVFDMRVAGELSAGRQQQAGAADVSRSQRNDETALGVQLTQELPTGTRLALGISGVYADTALREGQHQLRTGLSVTQRLLAGAGRDVVLASLHQARLNTAISRYEFQAYTEALVGTVIEAYWKYFLARRHTHIYLESLALAQRQVAETKDMIRVGRLAESELIAAEAEEALRYQDLIDARSNENRARLNLLRLLSPGDSLLEDREPELLEAPLLPAEGLDDVLDHIALALVKRPELHQARLGLERQDLELVKTRNGLLPRLDFFIGLGKSGYGTSFFRAAEDFPEDRYDARAGLQLDYVLGNRSSQARHQKAELIQSQALVALDNLMQLVELDVRLAYIEAQRAREQIDASASLVKLQEEKLRIITEKYRVGRSISFIVAQAQRDLTSARLSAEASQVGYLQALTHLYQMEGSLLERRGLWVP